MGEAIKNKLSVFHGIIYTILIIATIITAVIVYTDITNPFAVNFVVGYAVLIIIAGIYFLSYTILKMRKFKWIQIRRLLVRFLFAFILFWASSLLIIYLIKGEVNVSEKMFVPLGAAFGITFLPAKKDE
jgi:hypothetical protein